MTSHEFAQSLRAVADWLESRPEFPVPSREARVSFWWVYDDKENFIAAVKAIGAGAKTVEDWLDVPHTTFNAGCYPVTTCHEAANPARQNLPQNPGRKVGVRAIRDLPWLVAGLVISLAISVSRWFRQPSRSPSLLGSLPHDSNEPTISADAELREWQRRERTDLCRK